MKKLLHEKSDLISTVSQGTQMPDRMHLSGHYLKALPKTVLVKAFSLLILQVGPDFEFSTAMKSLTAQLSPSENEPHHLSFKAFAFLKIRSSSVIRHLKILRKYICHPFDV